jgi:hypothetical protein
MIKTAGVVFDFYDDHGEYLKQRLGAGPVPEAIANATVLDETQRASLPDNAFAAVVRNGDETLRKYACVDAGNTAASVVYFLGCSDKFPLQAKTKIAHNLVEACRYFEVVPPPALAKMALGKVLIRGDGSEIVAARERQARLRKEGDLTGTSILPITAGSSGRNKTASAVIQDPYTDVTSLEVATPQEHVDVSDDLYAMVSRDGIKSFPLVSWSQVKTAAEFFDDQGKRMHPRTRHEFCVKVASRAGELGVDVSDNIRKYGSQTYAPAGDLEVAVQTRRQLWREEHNEAVSLLDELMEKRAELDPATFSEVLANIDTMTGSDAYWDQAIPDPWVTTFGVSKTAEWRWVHGADVLTEEQLRTFAASSQQFLREHFNDDLAKGLAKDPITIFESLPLPQKRVIARLAAQQENGGNSAVSSIS